MPKYSLPEALFDPEEINRAVELVGNGSQYDSSLLVHALQDYMNSVDPTLDTYDPCRQLIAAFKMSNAAFLEDSWENWINVMGIHGIA